MVYRRLLTRHSTCEQPGVLSQGRDNAHTCDVRGLGQELQRWRTQCECVMAEQGRARTCCCFCSSMSTWLTPLRELGSVREAHLEQRWGPDGQGAEHRPQCGLHWYYRVNCSLGFCLAGQYRGTYYVPASSIGPSLAPHAGQYRWVRGCRGVCNTPIVPALHSPKGPCYSRTQSTNKEKTRRTLQQGTHKRRGDPRVN